MIPLKTTENYMEYLAIPINDYYKFILHDMFEIEIIPMDISSQDKIIRYQVSVKLTDNSKKRDSRPRFRNKPWIEQVTVYKEPHISSTRTHVMRGVIVEYTLFTIDGRVAKTIIGENPARKWTDYLNIHIRLSNTDKVIHKYRGTTTFKEVPIGEEWYFDNPYHSMYL